MAMHDPAFNMGAPCTPCPAGYSTFSEGATTAADCAGEWCLASVFAWLLALCAVSAWLNTTRAVVVGL
jgi:hypothetical protein